MSSSSDNEEISSVPLPDCPGLSASAQPPQHTDAVLDSHDDLRLALNVSAVGTWSWNPSTGQAHWDEHCQRMYGFSPDTPPSFETWMERVHPEDRPAVIARIGEMFSLPGDDEFDNQFRAVRPNGEVAWIHGLGRALRDASGNLVQIIGINLDITRRRREEQSVRNNEERLRLAAASAGFSHFDYDPVHDKAILSPKLKRLVGLAEPPPVSRHRLLPLFHPDDRIRFAQAVTAALRPAGDGRLDIECRLLPPHGELRWLHITGRGFFEREGASRHAVRIAGAVLDITAAKVADQFRKYSLRLADAIGALHDPIEIQTVAASLLANEIDTTRAFFAILLPEEGTARIDACCVREDAPPFTGTYRIRDFPIHVGQLRSGPVAVSDSRTSDLLTTDERAAFLAHDAIAAITVAQARAGATLATLAVQQSTSRAWTETDLDLVRETAQRTWAAAERARAEVELADSRERQAFLLAVNDGIRTLSDAGEIQAVACRMLGDHLHVNRVSYASLEGGQFLTRHTWSRRVRALPGAVDVAGSGQALLEALRAGETVTTENVASDPRFSGAERKNFRTSQIAAFALSPVLEENNWAALVSIHSKTRRTWSSDEIEVIREVAHRIWEACGRARAQSKLRDSERRLALVVRGGSDGIWDWDIAGGKLYVSSRFQELLGFAPGQFQWSFESWKSRIHPEDAARFLDTLQAHLASRTPFNVDYRLRTSSGEFRWFNGRGEAIWDADGKPSRMAGMLSSIDERVRTQEHAAELFRLTDNQLRAILQAAPLAILTIDRTGAVTSWNESARNIFGFAESEAIGRIDPTIPADLVPSFLELLAAALEGQTVRERTRRICKDGSSIHVALSMAPLAGAAQVRGAVVLAEDVTGMTEAAAELKAVRAALASAHEDEARRIALELHDEITQRLGLLSFEIGRLAAEPQPGDTIVAGLRYLQNQVAEITGAVRDISHRMHPSILDDLGLSSALKYLCAAYSRGKARPVRFHADELPAELPTSVTTCLYRIAQEALHNVERHAKAADVDVQLRLDGHHIQLSIRDSGVGFDSSGSSNGLGHHGMRERAERVNGTLTIDSQPGSGTRVVLTVPFADPSRLPGEFTPSQAAE